MIVETGRKSGAPLDWRCVAYKQASAMNSDRFQTNYAAGQFKRPDKERLALAEALYRNSSAQADAGIAPQTLLTRYRAFRIFVGFADQQRVALSVSTLRPLFTQWASHLAERKRRNELADHSQYGLVTRVAKQIADVIQLPVQEVMVGVKLKKPKHGTKRSRDKQDLDVTQQFVGDVIDVIGSLDIDTLAKDGPFPIRLAGSEVARVGLTTWRSGGNSRQRLSALNLRMASEFMLFIAATGMNRADATRLELTDYRFQSFENRVEVRSFKGRADAEVQFSIIPGYRPYFDSFIKFRERFFKDVDSTRLFLTLQPGGRANEVLVNTQPLANLLSTVGRHWVPPSILRRSKANVITRFASVDDAARQLQNTVGVLDRNYLYPAHQQALIEMSAFFNQLDEASKSREAVGPGSCNGDIASSSEFRPAMAPTPDCRHPAGCLFCSFNRGQRSFDYAWNLVSYSELKQIEFARYRYKPELPLHSAVSETLTRIREIFTQMEGDTELAVWLASARAVVEGGEYHPRWSHWIALAGI